jgi:restriction system protein
MANFENAFNTFMPTPPAFFAGRKHEIGILNTALIEGDARTALILGVGGIGKSALAQQFATIESRFFTGGVHRVPKVSPELLNEQTVNSLIGWGGRDRLAGPRLVILEDLDGHDTRQLWNLLSYLRHDPETRIIATSRANTAGFEVVIRLAPLSRDEMESVWRSSNLVSLTADQYQRLYDTVEGHPLAGVLAGALIRDRKTTPEELARYLTSYRVSGLVGLDGLPLKKDSLEEQRITSTVVTVSSNLAERISKDPDALYALDPRQFEELVAELFQRQGYTVDLTRFSKDGGKDIYVAKKSDLGSLLYLVQCKKYARHRKIGVGVVRELYGIVEKEKATGGIVATTSFFTREAKQFTEDLRYRLELKDYIDLHKWTQRLLARSGTNEVPKE